MKKKTVCRLKLSRMKKKSASCGADDKGLLTS